MRSITGKIHIDDLNLYEKLDCVHLICHNLDHGKFFLNNGIMFDIIDILSMTNTHHLIIRGAISCLSRLFYQIINRLKNNDLSDIKDIAFLFKPHELNQILESLLDQKQYKDITDKVRVCLTEINNIKNICSTRKCFYSELCKEFINSELNINGIFVFI